MKQRRSRWQQSWWAWASAAFLLHAGLVAILLQIRGVQWRDQRGVARAANSALGIIDVWVYQWIWQPLNTERFGRPFLKAAEFFHIRSMGVLLFAWEFLILSVFGGLVYAAIAVALWLKRRAHVQAVSTAA